MTNKEAIAILENLKIQGNFLFSQRLALDLAIKALEERPTEVNCSHCDYWKFSQSVIQGFVDIMVAHGFESIEELEEELHRLNKGKQEAENVSE